MIVNDTVEGLIRLPLEFSSPGAKSFYSLLEETGYFKAYDRISEDVIQRALLQQPSCVQTWMQWSSDKRGSEGWYFKQNDKGGYVVGRFTSKSGKNTQETEYSEAIKACAAFIKHEAEELRQL